MDTCKIFRSMFGNSFDRVRNHHGTVAIIVAICLAMLIGFAVLAIDVGYIYSTRNELQNVADAAALAGAGFLGSVYVTLDVADQQSHEFDMEDIVAAVQAVVNRAAGEDIDIDPADITVGIWTKGIDVNGNPYYYIEPMSAPLVGPDAVRVIARRDETENDAITTFFAGIFGMDEVPVVADATAALTGPESVAEGELKTPFAISEKYLLEDCGTDIIFYPTGESCAGWHNFEDDANATDLAATILGTIQGFNATDNPTYTPYVSQEGLSLVDGPTWLGTNFDMSSAPTAWVSDEYVTPAFNFIGGTVAALFNDHFVAPEASLYVEEVEAGELLEPVVFFEDEISGETYVENPFKVTDPYDGNEGDVLKSNGNVVTSNRTPAPIIALFDFFRYRDDDDNDLTWTATVPVYEDTTWQTDPDSCMNPNTTLNIVAYATITIRKVMSSPGNYIVGDITCGSIVVEGRGGGGLTGNTKGSIPNLVE